MVKQANTTNINIIIYLHRIGRKVLILFTVEHIPPFLLPAVYHCHGWVNHRSPSLSFTTLLSLREQRDQITTLLFKWPTKSLPCSRIINFVKQCYKYTLILHFHPGHTPSVRVLVNAQSPTGSLLAYNCMGVEPHMLDEIERDEH